MKSWISIQRLSRLVSILALVASHNRASRAANVCVGLPSSNETGRFYKPPHADSGFYMPRLMISSRMRIKILAIWVAESSVHNAPESDNTAPPAYSSR